MSNSHGKFVWYELMTTDPTAAEAFYRDVLGWGARDAGMPHLAYTLFTVADAPVAGLMALSDAAAAAGARPGWLGHVAVEDVDASTAQVTQAGGVVHHAPEDIPGVGRFAVVGDPQGAVIGLFRGTSAEPPPPPHGTPSHVGWRELLATDREAAFGFYANLFGWTKDHPFDMGAMGIYQIFAWAGQAIGGMMTRPEAVPAPFWLYYFTVDSINAAKARVEAGGGQVLNGPHQVPGGDWILQCRDPQGAMFALVGPQG